jgi:hypothetical protein
MVRRDIRTADSYVVVTKWLPGWARVVLGFLAVVAFGVALALLALATSGGGWAFGILGAFTVAFGGSSMFVAISGQRTTVRCNRTGIEARRQFRRIWIPAADIASIQLRVIPPNRPRSWIVPVQLKDLVAIAVVRQDGSEVLLTDTSDLPGSADAAKRLTSMRAVLQS